MTALSNAPTIDETIKAPPLALALTEIPRAMFETALLPMTSLRLLTAPRGDGHPVLLLPGFMTSDMSTVMLRGYLTTLGYRTYPWELGRNLGIRTTGMGWQKVRKRVEYLAQEAGQKVSLVGWSLGGVMARQVSRHSPDLVRQVITLGSPFTGNPEATNASELYQMMTGDHFDGPDAIERFAEESGPVPVPSSAIYSRQDGVAAWQNCKDAQENELTENIECYSSHMGLPTNPAVWFAIADRLSQKEGAWKPFDRSGRRSFYYPSE